MFKATCFIFLSLLSGVIGGRPGDAFDHRKNDYVPEGIRWMEIGFFYIYQNKWTRVEATYKNFTDPLVFLSLPNLAGETNFDGYPMSLRVRNTRLQYQNLNYKNYSFEAKSYGANDTPYCSQWKTYSPSKLILAPSFISWLVVERGMFNVSHHAFNINWDKINRTNVNDSSDARNRRRSFTMTGCFGSAVANCAWSNSFDATNLVAISQIQTTRFDRFLLLRGFSVFRRAVIFILTPQDSLQALNYLIPDPGEIYGFVIFEQGLRVTCVENLVIETYKYQVNYVKQNLHYANSFLIPPGVFGMVNTLLGRDSLGLRAFNVGVNSSDFITQEDQCLDDETTHENFETAAILIVGQTKVGKTVCGAVYNNNQPTSMPSFAPTNSPTSAPTFNANDTWCVDITLYDTFGDGWGPNIALKVWSDLTSPVYVYYSCPEIDPHHFCFELSDEAHFDIVVIDPPATETWEIYWTLDWIGFNHSLSHQLFLGDFDTNMTATYDSVDIWDPVDYQNQSCHRCKHPPKVSPKNKADDKDSESSKGHSDHKTVSEGTKGDKTVSEGTKGDDASTHASTGSSTAASNHSATDSDTDGPGADGPGADGKGKRESKPKPLFPFPFHIFDTTGTGWFNASETWTSVPAYSCDGSWEYLDHRELPTVITSPEYIISTVDRVHDIRRGTICGDFLAEDCEERLPDGKYVFRVTGALSRYDTANNTHWDFCGKRGTSMEELEFKLVKGRCFPGKLVSARDLCCGTTFALFNGVLTLNNVASEFLSEFDTSLLESDLAESMSSVISHLHGSISLNSWTMSGSTVSIPFSLKVIPSEMGLSGMSVNMMDDLAASLTSAAQTYTASGAFLSYLHNGIMDLPLSTEDVLYSVSSASISSLTFVDSSVTSGAESNTAPLVSVVETSTQTQSITTQLQAFQKSVGYVFGSIALFAVVVGAVLGARHQSRASTYEEISQESSRRGDSLLTEEVSRGAGINSRGIAESAEELPSEKTPNFF